MQCAVKGVVEASLFKVSVIMNRKVTLFLVLTLWVL